MQSHPKILADFEASIVQEKNGKKSVKEKRSHSQDFINSYFSSTPTRNTGACSRADNRLGDALAVKWVCESLRPYSIVEDKGLIDLTSFLNTVKGRYELKTRNTVQSQTSHLRIHLEDTMKRIIRNESEYVTLTVDIWTSRNGSSFITVTLHYLTEEFRMRLFTLEVAPFPGVHSGENIKQFLEVSFARWGI